MTYTTTADGAIDGPTPDDLIDAQIAHWATRPARIQREWLHASEGGYDEQLQFLDAAGRVIHTETLKRILAPDMDDDVVAEMVREAVHAGELAAYTRDIASAWGVQVATFTNDQSERPAVYFQTREGVSLGGDDDYVELRRGDEFDVDALLKRVLAAEAAIWADAAADAIENAAAGVHIAVDPHDSDRVWVWTAQVADLRDVNPFCSDDPAEYLEILFDDPDRIPYPDTSAAFEQRRGDYAMVYNGGAERVDRGDGVDALEALVERMTADLNPDLAYAYAVIGNAS